MTYKIAVLGFTSHYERLIDIVISRAPSPKYRYIVGTAGALDELHIAIANSASEHAETQLAELRTLNPALVVVYVSDLGLSGNSSYRIERNSLFLRVNRVLDDAVERELLNHRAASAIVPMASKPVAKSRQATDKAFVNVLAAVAQAPLKPLRALIVDDSLTVREQLRSVLDRAGIFSDQADSGESAMVQISANTYDIVFLDVVMPGANGYEVCRSIKKNAHTRGISVLMLTSRSSPFDRARGALAGCDSYLVKPITWETFFTAVDKVLAKHSQNDRALLSARGYRVALSG